MALNPDCAVDTYCGFKSLAVTLVSLLSVASLSPTLSGRVPGFTIFTRLRRVNPQHIYEYVCGSKSLQLRVSLRFYTPRYGIYCTIWVKCPPVMSMATAVDNPGLFYHAFHK